MEETLSAPAPNAPAAELEPPTERRASREEVVETIHRLAGQLSAQELTSDAVSRRYRRVHADALDLFGTWEVALATALRTAIAPRRPKQPPTQPISGEAGAVAPAAPRRPSVLRQPHPNAHRPVLIGTEDGSLLKVPGDALAASETARPPAPVGPLGGASRPAAIFDVAACPTTLGLTHDGHVCTLNPAAIPGPGDAGPERQRRPEHFVELFDLADVKRAQLLVVATRCGKVRAVKIADVLEAMEATPRWRACKLGDDDVPVAAWLAELGDAMVLVASTGHVIAFDLASLRGGSRPGASTPLNGRPVAPASGRNGSSRSERQQGVRGMQLKDGATVVGGIIAKPGVEAALITRAGKARRVPVDAFRPQARGGLGAPCTRLDEGDALVAALACHPSTDLVVMTSEARALRMPATRLPLTERLGDAGTPILELDASETILGASRVLPMAYASDAPNVFEI